MMSHVYISEPDALALINIQLGISNQWTSDTLLQARILASRECDKVLRKPDCTSDYTDTVNLTDQFVKMACGMIVMNWLIRLREFNRVDGAPNRMPIVTSDERELLWASPTALKLYPDEYVRREAKF